MPLLLAGLEVGLRLGRYGYPTGFFKTLKIKDETYLVPNDDFSLRFFPKEISRKPEPFRIKAVKPPGKFRIFIFGESAALGDPEPAFGAGRYLEVLLRERFPGADFEIINAAFTAINSHVILPIARDCATERGDLWIVYMGNNEMVGPFGAATVFGAQTPPLLFVKLSLALQKSRSGQLFMALARKLGGHAPKSQSWRGMEMFLDNRVPPGSAKKARAYQNFQSNLDEILRCGLGSGAKIILNTVTVNLKDSPPFASILSSNLPSAGRQQFDLGLAQAKEWEIRGDLAQARLLYEATLKQDPRFAEAQFRLGRCLLNLTNRSAAREPLQLACDNDALPFRADSRINSLIRKAGRRFAKAGLILCDPTPADGAASLAIPGEETFYEHVHFNFDGNYRLARAWGEQALKVLAGSITSHDSGQWAAQDTCERRLGLTDWNRVFVYESVISRLQQPPLNSQSNNPERLKALREKVDELRQRTNPVTASNAAQIYLDAIQRAPEDHLLYENFAKFLESTKNLRPALRQWKRVYELFPNNYRAFYQSGRLCEALGLFDEARSELNKAVTLNPRLAEAWFELGNVHFRTGLFEPALQSYEHAARLEPINATYCIFAAKALSKLERRPQAIRRYRQAVNLQPDLWLAHFALADELMAGDQFAEAGEQYEQVIHLRPTNALAHLNLGLAQLKVYRFDAALKEFEETLRLDPANQPARDYLDQLQKPGIRPP